MQAVQHDHLDIVQLLLDSGAQAGLRARAPLETPRGHLLDWAVAWAQSPAVLHALVAAGEPMAWAEAHAWRCAVGIPGEILAPGRRDDVSSDDLRARPAVRPSPFHADMIRGGRSGYVARRAYGLDKPPWGDPVWCFERFGRSLTPLPDGRVVAIAGEHEDFYDPDFFIYNDVVVFDGDGGFELFCYPHSEFPPTDFHSATFVPSEGAIYIIGNVGYQGTRQAGVTPVLRLSLETMTVSAVATAGEPPGWLSDHIARYDPARNAIGVGGGKVWGGSNFAPQQGTAWLLLDERRWVRGG